MHHAKIAARKKASARAVEVEVDGYHWIATEGSILVPAERAVVITIGIVLKSQKHGMSHNWKAEHGRRQWLRKRAQQALSVISPVAAVMHLRGRPTRIVFTRLAPRRLDDDNLTAAFKPIRDQVCAWLSGNNAVDARANDGMRSGYTFEYRQQQQRAHGVRVELC